MPRAEKYIKKIKDKKFKELLKIAFIKISQNPYIGQAKKGDLTGIYGYDVFYNKTNYEISYRIYEKQEKIVVVILIGTRENFYQELKNYIKES